MTYEATNTDGEPVERIQMATLGIFSLGASTGRQSVKRAASSDPLVASPAL